MRLVAWAALEVLLLGCSHKDDAAKVGDDQVVARIDDEVITRADFERHLSQQPAYVRARYASPERRKELLDNLVRFEVMAREAERRGYGRDPEVVRFVKERTIEQMIAQDLDAKLKPEALPEADVERYYREHPATFTQNEAVRVSQILVSDHAEAVKLVGQARALSPRDEDGFRKLVEAHSEDQDSKQRGGDLTFLERGSRDVPANVIDAAFALREIGDVSGPVQGPRGYHVLRLTQRRPGFLRPYEDVKTQARNRLYAELRGKQIDDWVAKMRERVKIEIYEDKLKDIPITP